MTRLNPNWLTEPCIDFEYKKYLLLGWLQHVETSFLRHQLYPVYNDLWKHHRALQSLRTERSALRDLFHRELIGLHQKRLELQYQDLYEDSALMDEIGSIIEFAIPSMASYLEEGSQLKEAYREALELDTVGIIPLYQREGYLMLSQQNQASVYHYKLNLIQELEEPPRPQISTAFVTEYTVNFTTNYEYIKSDLMKKQTELPNPATYVVKSSMELPAKETFLPLAKEILFEYISERA